MGIKINDMENLINEFLKTDIYVNGCVTKRDNYIFIDEQYIESVCNIFSLVEKDIEEIILKYSKNNPTKEIFLLKLELIPEIFKDIFSRDKNYCLLLGLMQHVNMMKIKFVMDVKKEQYFRYLEGLIVKELITNKKTVKF